MELFDDEIDALNRRLGLADHRRDAVLLLRAPGRKDKARAISAKLVADLLETPPRERAYALGFAAPRSGLLQCSGRPAYGVAVLIDT